MRVGADASGGGEAIAADNARAKGRRHDAECTVDGKWGAATCQAFLSQRGQPRAPVDGRRFDP
jgi:hypothetical protein